MKDEFIKIEVRRRADRSLGVAIRHLGEDGYIYTDAENVDSAEEASAWVENAINGARKSYRVRQAMQPSLLSGEAKSQAGTYTGKELEP